MTTTKSCSNSTATNLGNIGLSQEQEMLERPDLHQRAGCSEWILYVELTTSEVRTSESNHFDVVLNMCSCSIITHTSYGRGIG